MATETEIDRCWVSETDREMGMVAQLNSSLGGQPEAWEAENVRQLGNSRTTGGLMEDGGPAPGGDATSSVGRRAIAGGIVLVVALIHVFRLGTHLRGSLFTLYYSYASDILVPLGMYFLLCLIEAQLVRLRAWQARALLVFAVASSSEVLQGFGVPILGRTFDPLDFLMFAVGVSVAVFLDRIALPAIFRCWSMASRATGHGVWP